MKEKKQHWTNIWPWVPAGPDARCERAGWLPAVSFWSRVPRDSDPRKTTLARISSIYKRQTRPDVRQGAPQKHDRN
jgi:hypothetical protein